jgi:hypothetical protein
MFRLFHFPDDILVILFNEWINDLIDIVQFDTACSMSIRYQWRLLVKQIIITDTYIDHDKRQSLKPFYEWCLAKDIQLKSISANEYNLEGVLDIPFLCLPHVRSINFFDFETKPNYIISLIRRCPNVTTICDGGCFTDKTMIAITKIPKLQIKSLAIEYFPSISSIFAIANNLSSPLHQFELYSSLTEEMLDIMIGSPIFHKLEVFHVGISSPGIVCKGKFGRFLEKVNINLKSLEIQKNLLDVFETFESFVLPKLDRLYIDMFQLLTLIITNNQRRSTISYGNITQETLRPILLSLPEQTVETIKFECSRAVDCDEEVLHMIADRFGEKIQHLELQLADSVSVGDISYLLSNCKHLSSLLLQGSVVTNQVLKEIAKFGKNLKSIKFNRTSITDDGISILFEQLGSQLEYFGIRDNKLITPVIFDSLLNSTSLKQITTMRNPLITSHSIVIYLLKCVDTNRKLKFSVDYSEYLKIDETFLKALENDHKCAMAKSLLKAGL